MRNVWRFSALAVLVATSASAESGMLRIWDFDSGVFNALGGAYNSYGSEGCDVVLQRTPRICRGAAGQSLKITYRNAKAASCGMWMHLFGEDDAPAERTFPDMTRFPYVSFWVLNNGRPQDAEVRMADPMWLARDDSRPAGTVGSYLGKSEHGWREIVIPFRDFQLSGTKAAVFALQFFPGTSGVLYVDDLYLKGNPDIRAARSLAGASGRETTSGRRAMWLWETEALLKDARRQQNALSTLREAAVTDVFLQTPYRRTEGESSVTELTSRSELRAFLRFLHASEIRVHALDGYPEFALRTQHETVLSLVRSILTFNQAGAKEERFDGIHLDNEPYQLLGFDGPAREHILSEYLELNEKAAALLNGTGVVLGVDIPFWWDSAGEDGRPCCLVTFRGVRKNAGQHVLDLVDNAGVMAYRNFAGGLDGIINHAQREVRYASVSGKQVFVAIETFRPAALPVTFIAAIRESDWQALPAEASVFGLSRFDGYALRSFTDGEHRYIGLAGAAGDNLESAIQKLCAALVSLSSGFITNLRKFQPRLERSMMQSRGEWQRMRAVKSTLDYASAWRLRVTETMPPKVTFAGKSREFVKEMLQEVRRAFDHEPGFAGDAIHSLEFYQDLGRKQAQ